MDDNFDKNKEIVGKEVKAGIGRFWNVVYICWLLLVALVGVGTAINGVFFDSWTTTGVALAGSGVGLVAFYAVTELIIRVIRYVVKGIKIHKGRPSRLQGVLLVMSLSILVLGLVFIPIDRAKEKRATEQAKADAEKAYTEAKLSYDTLRPDVAACLTPIIEKGVKNAIYECNKRKNKVRADYDFCVSLESINTPASCIYENDYTVINCSESYIKEKTPFDPGDLKGECRTKYNAWAVAQRTIEIYELDNGIFTPIH